MKIKTAELEGAALDWLVDSIEDGAKPGWVFADGRVDGGCKFYSTDWAQGGPIIEREKISLGSTFTGPEGSFAIQTGWYAYRHIYGGVINPARYTGSTPLIAVCRCYVASKLGDEVEVPDELA